MRLTNKHTGEVLDIDRVTVDGEDAFRLRGTLPAHREGPPLHVHHLEDEEGSITAGVLSVEVNGERREVGAGGTVRLPRGVPHRWWNDGDVPLAFDGLTRPAVDLDRYLQAVFEVMNAGPPGRPPLVYMAHVAVRHSRTQSVLIMPPALQWVVFRVAVAIGTLLGKYRGAGWPGCPTRCTGAEAVAPSTPDTGTG